MEHQVAPETAGEVKLLFTRLFVQLIDDTCAGLLERKKLAGTTGAPRFGGGF